MSGAKSAFITFGVHSRPVSYQRRPGQTDEVHELTEAIRLAFRDVLPSSSVKLHLKVKNKDWGGEYTDISETLQCEGAQIPDRAFILVTVLGSTHVATAAGESSKLSLKVWYVLLDFTFVHACT